MCTDAIIYMPVNPERRKVIKPLCCALITRLKNQKIFAYVYKLGGIIHPVLYNLHMFEIKKNLY